MKHEPLVQKEESLTEQVSESVLEPEVVESKPEVVESKPEFVESKPEVDLNESKPEAEIVETISAAEIVEPESEAEKNESNPEAEIVESKSDKSESTPKSDSESKPKAGMTKTKVEPTAKGGRTTAAARTKPGATVPSRTGKDLDKTKPGERKKVRNGI